MTELIESSMDVPTEEVGGAEEVRGGDEAGVEQLVVVWN